MKENKMKPKRTQGHTGPSWQGKGVSAGDRARTLSQAKPTSLVSSRAQVKPFAGKVFYLDLPSNRTAETLENDIKELGGTVEKFFSKDIKYLVSNKREAKYVQSLRQDSPVPSPDSGQSSPHPRSKLHRPGSHGNHIKSRTCGQTETLVTSRGKSLVERVVKEQERIQMNKILSNALEWGVKILHIDDIRAYVLKKKKSVSGQSPATTAVKISVKAESVAKQGFQKCRAGRISKPFIKVEDSSRHYRPIYLTMPNVPEFNLKTAPPCSPFCVEDKDPPGNKQRGQRGASASEERVHGRKKNKGKKRGGYCECCMMKYENVTTSERHKTFSKSDKYLVVDKLVSTLRCNFIHIRTQVKRPKCSVSSVLLVPGPCGMTEMRQRRYLCTTEILKDERCWTADGHEGSHSGQTLKVPSVPASAPQRDRRSYSTHSDRSKDKSLARKHDSSTSSPQISPQPNMETAPSRGECRASFPCRVDQDMNSSASRLQTMNEILTEEQPEESDKKRDSAHDGNVLLDEMTGNNLSKEEEPANLPSQKVSPVRKIQRRIRVYKRKRRKLDKRVEQPSDIPENSTLAIWELFQSSDDVDEEFLGFEDE